MDPSTFLEYSAVGAIWIMTISMVFPLIRLFRGPTLPDRVIALDQISIIIVCIIICDSIYSKNTYGLDVALVVSLLLVIGSMIIASFLHKRRSEND